MDRGSYIAANGMMAQQQRLDVIANNLANVSTRGFKADSLTFGDMMRRTLADDAGYGQEVATLSSGPESKDYVTDFQSGGSEETGNPLDMRLGGSAVAMFAVQGADGKTHYTRDGEFRLKNGTDLVTRDGDAVLGVDGKPITGLGGKIKVASDGQINSDGGSAQLARYVGRFSKAEQGGNLFDGQDVRPATSADDVAVEQGSVETSNVNPVLAMVDLISIQRAYEISQKMVQSQDESTSKLAEAMS